MCRVDFWTLWEKARMGCSERIAWKQVSYQGWNRSPAHVGCMRQVLRAGALGRHRGTTWGGRGEWGSGWGTHVNPWLIHVSVWQKPLQYCKVFSLQLIKLMPVSPWKHQKFIKIWNDSYRETSKGQQKTPGLQKSKIVSLYKVGQKIRAFKKKNGRDLQDGCLCHVGGTEFWRRKSLQALGNSLTGRTSGELQNLRGMCKSRSSEGKIQKKLLNSNSQLWVAHKPQPALEGGARELKKCTKASSEQRAGARSQENWLGSLGL